MLSVGQVLNNRYRIVRWIADGGQSTVYLAADERTFGRQVVIKEFKLGVGTPTDLETAKQQFEASAKMLSQLSHPGIVQVIDYFFSENVPILVTEYVRGETLEGRVTLAPLGLSEKQVISITDQLCDVLSYLHGQKPPIIYRDLTPGNVILTVGDKVKLIDFGIARTFKEGKSTDTEPLGTAGYAPPEQHGKSQTGPYSDVYSLGATLLRATTGYDPSLTPFMLPRADRVNGDLKTVSPALSDAIEKATQVDIRKRFQSVGEFRKAVHRSESLRGMARGASIGLVLVVVLVGMLLCSGIGLMLGSAFGAFNATATPGQTDAAAKAEAVANGPIRASTQTASPSSSATASAFTATPLVTGAPAPTPALTSMPTVTPISLTGDAAPAAVITPVSTSTPTETQAPSAASSSPTGSGIVSSPTPASPPASTPTSTPVPTTTPTPTSIPTATPDPTSTPLPSPSPTPIPIELPVAGTGDFPQPRIDGVGIPGKVKFGQPFEVTVWASNIGGAPANGGSITLSFPEAAEVKIIDADNNIINLEPDDCNFGNGGSYARVITPDSRCRSVLSYTTCQVLEEPIRYPIAESWFPAWEAGKQHYIKVRVVPRGDADLAAVNIRVAMGGDKAEAQQCQIFNSPSASETTERDQQAFPVRTYYVVVSGSEP